MNERILRAFAPHATAALVALTLFASGCSRGSQQTSDSKEAWNPANAPEIFGLKSARYDSIPLSANLTDAKATWSGSYWPTYQGGVSYRWQVNRSQSENYRDYIYQPMTAAQSQNLSSDQLNLLSPAEKYDLLVGRTDFPLTRSEQQNVQSVARQLGNVPTWNGICHGWAAASTREPQPGATARVNLPDGRSMDFNYSDLQALSSRTYSDFNTYQYAFIGGRCDSQRVDVDANGRPTDANCRDVNPGTFHLVIGEFIGHKQQSFIADISNDEQVWNQPITGYQMQASNLRAFNPQDGTAAIRAPGTTQLIDINVDLTFTDEAANSFNPTPAAKDKMHVSYQLELDANGMVIGGEWTSKDRPDFLWQVTSAPNIQNGLIDYNIVHKLVQQSLSSQPTPIPTPTPTPTPVPMPSQIQLNIGSFQLIDDAGLRDLAQVTGNVKGGGAAAVELMVIIQDGDQRSLERARLGAGGDFVLQGRVFSGRIREYRLLILDANMRVIGSQSLGGG